ncbi:MAG: hypothetical protein WDN50_00355 [Bradyrhizobium sp.]
MAVSAIFRAQINITSILAALNRLAAVVRQKQHTSEKNSCNSDTAQITPALFIDRKGTSMTIITGGRLSPAADVSLPSVSLFKETRSG